jgi:Domain of Unknown Function (DUF1080)
MQRRHALTAFVSATSLAMLGCASTASGTTSAEAGWITLLDGNNINAWEAIGNANWRITDSLVQAELGSGYLVSKKSYKDFQIRAEFWVDDEANSGIFLRCANPKEITADNSYEVNIFDQRPDPSYGTGAIVNHSKISPMPKAGGRWNVYEITAKGPQLAVWLNGVQTANISTDKFASGPIALQRTSGVVKFRKLQIRPL